MICHGNADSHCCWIDGVECPYLEEGTVEGRRWACGLLRELGTWDAVYRSTRYRRSDAGKWFKTNLPGFGCGDWPQNIPEAIESPVGKCCWQGDT